MLLLLVVVVVYLEPDLEGAKVKIIYNFLTMRNEPSRIVRNPFKLGSPYPMVLL